MFFNVHERAPVIIHLAVHIENRQRVYFTENNINDIVNNPRDTKLIAFLKLCLDNDLFRNFTYNKASGSCGTKLVKNSNSGIKEW